MKIEKNKNKNYERKKIIKINRCKNLIRMLRNIK